MEEVFAESTRFDGVARHCRSTEGRMIEAMVSKPAESPIRREMAIPESFLDCLIVK